MMDKQKTGQTTTSPQPSGGPAHTLEELAGLVFDVPCAVCGEIVFALPYVAGVHHIVHCHKCGEETWITVDDSGSIIHLPAQKARLQIKRAAVSTEPDKDEVCPSCESDYPGWRASGYSIKGTEVQVRWRCSECGDTIDVMTDWLAEEGS